MVMSSPTCIDKCKCARICARNGINRPSPRVREQRFQKYEPKLKQDCRGFINLDDDSTTY
jgi:hypothetical protein